LEHSDRFIFTAVPGAIPAPSPWDPSEDPGQLSPATPEFGDVQNWFVDTLW